MLEKDVKIHLMTHISGIYKKCQISRNNKNSKGYNKHLRKKNQKLNKCMKTFTTLSQCREMHIKTI